MPLTGARKRYPRRATVSTKRGFSAESPSESRNLLTAVFYTVFEIDEGIGRPQPGP